MNNDEYELDMMKSLSPEEEAAIDRILAETAAADDAEVDYAAILDGVRAKARAEGIAIFSPAAKKPVRKKLAVWAKVLSGIAAAAAVFVVSFFAVNSLLGTQKAPSSADQQAHNIFDSDKKGGPSYSAEDSQTLSPHAVADDTINTFSPAARGSSAPAETQNGVIPSPTEDIAAVVTEAPDPTPSFEPIDPVIRTATEIPTELPVKGGVEGYFLIEAPDGELSRSDELIPAGLPAFMERVIYDGMPRVYARGVEDGKVYAYSCMAVSDIESDLGVGAARYRASLSGEISYLWRIGESSYLLIDTEGFTREEGDELLRSISFGNER